MDLPTTRSPRHARRRPRRSPVRLILLLVVLVVAAVVATVIAVTVTSSPGYASVYTGTLTRGDRSHVHTITLDDPVTVTATLEFASDPEYPGTKQMTASIAIRRQDSGEQVNGRYGATPIELTLDLPRGSYDVVVSTRWPLIYRDLNYTLTVGTEGQTPSSAPTSVAPSTPPAETTPTDAPSTTATTTTSPPTEPTTSPTSPTPTATTPAMTPTVAPPAAAGNIGAACGTWVLQQASSTGELDRLRPRIEDALALPGVTGLSLRFPWDAADLTGARTTTPLLDLASDIAARAGKRLAIRFMAGAHTPQRVFDAGAAFYIRDGQQVPLPWDNATGSHQIFLGAYAEYAGRLATWARAHDVRLLHLSWYGQDWAELNNGAEVRAAPGYSEAAWLDGHRDLVDVGIAISSQNLAVELPLSGYGPLSNGLSAALAAYIVDRLGPDNDRFFIQANGWDETREWGSPNDSVEQQFDRIWDQQLVRGLQMIQPDGYDWARVYARLVAVDATYGEVYLPSFWQVPGPTSAFSHNTPSRIDELEAAIAQFARSRCGG
jgi:hypothetical protein